MARHTLFSITLAAFTLWANCLCLNAQTEQKQTTAQDEVTIGIFALNDFHAGFVRNDAKHIPGAPAVLQTIDSLKREYPYHLVVGAGDAFGGSYFYSMTRNRTLLPQFYKDLELQVSAIGNHEFDEGQEKLAAKWGDTQDCPKHFDLTYVSANIRDSLGRIPHFAKPYAIQNIPLNNKDTVKVAFIGLTTANTPGQVNVKRIKGLSFDVNYKRVLDSLKQTSGYEEVENADLRFILTHIGSAMKDGKAVWVDCGEEYLYSIDDPTLHGFFTSHSHEVVCSHINDAQYPIVQGLSHGNYISMVEVKYNITEGKVKSVVPRLIRVFPKSQLEISPRRLEAQIREVLEEMSTPGGTPLGTPVTHFATELRHNRQNKFTQTPVGTLVCQSYAETYRRVKHLSEDDIIIGVSHFGSIRAGFPKGEATVLDVGETLPFANGLRIYELSGAQLCELIAFGIHNWKYGQIQTSYLEYSLNKKGSLNKLYYVKGNIRKEIKKREKYIMVVDDYITNGGDGYAKRFFPEEQEIKLKEGEMPMTTDAFIHYLSTKK